MMTIQLGNNETSGSNYLYVDGYRVTISGTYSESVQIEPEEGSNGHAKESETEEDHPEENTENTTTENEITEDQIGEGTENTTTNNESSGSGSSNTSGTNPETDSNNDGKDSSSTDSIGIDNESTEPLLSEVTRTLTLGQQNQSSQEFMSSETAPTYRFVHLSKSNPEQKQVEVRPWIGHSDCLSCGSGSVNHQKISFGQLPIGSEVAITVNPWFSSSQAIYTANAADEKVVLTGGSNQQFGIGYVSQPWIIRFTTVASSTTITIGNSKQTGYHYLYIDSIDITTKTKEEIDPDRPLLLQNSIFSSSTGQVTSFYTSPDGVLRKAVWNGEKYEIRSSRNELLTTINSPQGSVSNAYDYDQDGVTDLAISYIERTGISCGQSILNKTWFMVYSGATGEPLTSVSPLNDTCFPGLGYGVTVWGAGTISGDMLGNFIANGQYLNAGYMFKKGRNILAYYLPTTTAFGALYPQAQTTSSGTKHVNNSNSMNSLVLTFDGLTRLVLFSSERISQYLFRPLGSSQLYKDISFKGYAAGGGRLYGLAAQDKQAPHIVALVSEATSYSLYRDMVTNTIAYDPGGALERHILRYNGRTNTVDQKFYSYAAGTNTSNKYINRIASPANYLLPSAGNMSHIVFNLLGQGTWNTHITSRDSVQSQIIIQDRFVWDVQDLNGDGQYEIISSDIDSTKTSRSSQYYPTGKYFTKWQTKIYTWDPETFSLTLQQTINGIPTTRLDFSDPQKRQSSGYNAEVVYGNLNGKLTLITTLNEELDQQETVLEW